MQIIGQMLMLIVAFNFFHHAIRMFRSMTRQIYDENAVHRLQCSKCEEIHTITGPEAKKLRWAPRVEKRTPRSQSTAYRFTCPHCHKHASQIVLYDTNVTKGAGMVRVQMNEEQKPLLIEFLIKGLLPVIFLSSIYRFF
ncbi:hypothetical protein [Sporosarcina ureilytica]|uniref:Uncharacterized protein n=1 Tax=Sporosarcina ureilytica TaxID=298596 RepID=A0A1D8JIZ5_9BACL|nr:hypothetical protein [Sporosarcina ureilytica]AOV08684.1 hypothetical protein BI350_14815 [Sporosarcina ureilytica]